MKKKCPECGEMFSGYKCECGYKISHANKAPTYCKTCSGTGFVCAWKPVKNHAGKTIGDYKAFKCGCSNSPAVEYVYSDGNKKLAVWDEGLRQQGWKL